MKKYFLLFIFLFLLSCRSEKPQSFNDLCPQVLFSKDHRIYITTEENSLTINNLSYKAEMNNYNFAHGCILLNNEISAKLSILFIVKPDKAKQTDIIMPYYIALLDDQKNIVNIQYYTAQGVLKKNFDESSYIETEITTTQDIIIPIQNMSERSRNKLLIGFMLDQKKIKILN